MSIRENKFPVKEIVVPGNILVSVHDKTGLDELVAGILEQSPAAIFFSTGGTGTALERILGHRALIQYKSIEEFTNCPAMEGGLVKTLHPKVHAGLLGERENPEHMRFIEDVMQRMTGTLGVYFDLLVCNFYPFNEVIAKPDATPERARVNIDIGGPTMVRAAAKNWHSVAVLVSPEQYKVFLGNLRAHSGVTAYQRFEFAVAAFRMIADYDAAIAQYLSRLNFEREVKSGLTFS